MFNRIAQDTAVAKHKKLQSALHEHSHLLEDEYSRIRGSKNVCRLCEQRPVEGDLCKVCSYLVKLGGLIPKARYIGIDWLSDKHISKPLLPGGASLHLYKSEE